MRSAATSSRGRRPTARRTRRTISRPAACRPSSPARPTACSSRPRRSTREFAGLNPRRAMFPSQLWDPPVAARHARRRARGDRLGRDARRARRPGAGASRPRRRARAPPRGARRDHGRSGAAAPRWRRSPPAARSSFIPAGSFERAQRFCRRDRHRDRAARPTPLQPLPRRRPVPRVRRARRAGDLRRPRALPRRGPPRTDRLSVPRRRRARDGPRTRARRGGAARGDPGARRALPPPSGSNGRTPRTGWGSICRSRRRWGSGSAAASGRARRSRRPS